MNQGIFSTLLLNIGLMLMLASVLAEVKLVRHWLLLRDHSFGRQFPLTLMFGLISILSTYTGGQVQGAIVNTRVIGVLAAGLLGGPSVGIGTAIIGGIHRYLFDISGFTSLACAVSTLVEGFIGAAAYGHFQRGKATALSIALMAAIAEVGQMVIILLLAKPFDAALQLVRVISGPMIILNSFGMVMFFSIFNRIYKERDLEISRQQSLALTIAEQCLHELRNGLQNQKAMGETVRVICAAMPDYRVVILSKEEVLADSGMPALQRVPTAAHEAMYAGITISAQEAPPEDELHLLLNKHCAIASPLKQKGEPIGALMVLTKQQWLTSEADVSFVDGLAKLFSTMLELSEVANQTQLRRKAEFRALQAQINPHFLYNALNTLASCCREDPDLTRSLLLVLGNYFRHTLEINKEYIPLSDEVEAVRCYLLLEYARFEDNLQVHWEIDPALSCMVPPLILQPIVENAVKHGANAVGIRHVSISIRQEAEHACLAVQDQGHGFPQKVLERLLETDVGGYSGLFNVHRRLKSIYGEENGLKIASDDAGSRVSFCIPLTAELSSK